MVQWKVYMVRCVDNTYYTGIATDVQRRLDEHNGSGKLGAKYTRARQPVELIYEEQVASRSQALRREIAIKKLTRKRKELLVLMANSI